jgi:peroxiredoxin
MHAILLLAFLQASPALEQLRSGCSVEDRQIAAVSAADSIQVQMALAGDGPGICYKVAVIKPGETVTGYVLGESLPAVAEFVRSRELASREAAEAQARAAAQAPAAPKAGVKAPAKPVDPNLPSQIDNFSWRDWKGKGGSLSGLGGRAILVTFWNPTNMRSRDQLNAIQPLYNELHRSGLAAVGVSMDPNPKQMFEVLDDTNFSWPQVPDQSGLAARYHVNPKAGETFVLDASHHVVAAGPMGPEIVKAVRELLAAP